MKRLIDKLRHYHSLTGEEYANLLSCQDTGTLLYLQQQAREVTLAHFGNGIFIRGLIEVSNRCRNNCHYCGIRKGNTAITRYALKRETILECCREGYALGFRTFVMQGGEDPALTDEWIEKTVAAIHCEFPDCAITLSLGKNHGKHTNVSSVPEPTVICSDTKHTTKNTIGNYILRRCH